MVKIVKIDKIIHEHYKKRSLNPMLRMDYRIKQYLEEIKQLPINLQNSILIKYKEFCTIKKKFMMVKILRYTCLAFVYISLISIATNEIPIIGFFANELLFISGLIGIPIFVTALFFLESYSSILAGDAHFISSEIISMAILFQSKKKEK